MERKQQGRSGIAFFFVAVGLIFTAIAATVLLANEQRHLKQLLAGLGFAMTPPQTERPPEAARGPRKKPEPPKALLPAHIFADLATPEQQFIRQIRSDPRALCEGLREAGFRDLEWKSAESGRWECSSLVPFARPGQEPSSSIFILVKGRGEEEITSFRVKLNIEHSGDTPVVTSAAAKAASVFLSEVRWAGGRKHHSQDPGPAGIRSQALRQSYPVQTGDGGHAPLQLPCQSGRTRAAEEHRRALFRPRKMADPGRRSERFLYPGPERLGAARCSGRTAGGSAAACRPGRNPGPLMRT